MSVKGQALKERMAGFHTLEAVGPGTGTRMAGVERAIGGLADGLTNMVSPSHQNVASLVNHGPNGMG